MRRHQTISSMAIAIGLLISTLGCSTSSPSEQGKATKVGSWAQTINWTSDVEAAAKTAKQAGKGLFIYLTEDG